MFYSGMLTLPFHESDELSELIDFLLTDALEDFLVNYGSFH